MKKLLFVSLLATTVATPALAQDRMGPTGLRVEGRVGWDRVNITGEASSNGVSAEDSTGRSGVTYGGELGYDMGFPNVVAGVYAGIEGADTKYCEDTPGVDETCLKSGRNITAGVRVGYVASTRALLYIKGGYSNGQLKLAYRDLEDSAYDFDAHSQLDGFHLGAGAEMRMMRNVYAKVEYVYTNYKGYREVLDDVDYHVDLDRHQVVAGVGFRF